MSILPTLLGRLQVPQSPKCKAAQREKHPTVAFSVPLLDVQKTLQVEEDSCEHERARGLSLLGNVLKDLWMPIIRPPRWVPTEKELNRVQVYAVKTKEHTWFYERTDLQLKNSRGQRLECCHYLPCASRQQRRPCVVYLHGASSSRLEANRKDMFKHLLQYDVSVFCFDFSGSGQSEGEYVSLGANEEQDLRVVLDYLRRSRLVSSIGLWGWSMGAVTAILRASQDPLISACVLDSPFADFRMLASELASSAAPMVPGMLEGLAVQFVSDEVRARAGFNPLELKPAESASNVTIPALFGVGEDDTLTAPHHTQKVYSNWNGPKEIHTFKGDHNSQRPAWFLKKGARFLWDSFQTEASDKHLRTGPFFIFNIKADERKLQMIREGKPVRVRGGCEPLESKIPAHHSPTEIVV